MGSQNTSKPFGILSRSGKAHLLLDVVHEGLELLQRAGLIEGLPILPLWMKSGFGLKT